MPVFKNYQKGIYGNFINNKKRLLKKLTIFFNLKILILLTSSALLFSAYRIFSSSYPCGWW